eukprot:GGOE01019153.1.p1 GENE.GGOE01019153.1~~GGOE01019153.1.p1  ORF type:complete len:931 (+),score=191.71 GGOE01019153.1:68-2860(+)
MALPRRDEHLRSCFCWVLGVTLALWAFPGTWEHRLGVRELLPGAEWGWASQILQPAATPPCRMKLRSVQSRTALSQKAIRSTTMQKVAHLLRPSASIPLHSHVPLAEDSARKDIRTHLNSFLTPHQAATLQPILDSFCHALERNPLPRNAGRGAVGAYMASYLVQRGVWNNSVLERIADELCAGSLVNTLNSCALAALGRALFTARVHHTKVATLMAERLCCPSVFATAKPGHISIVVMTTAQLGTPSTPLLTMLSQPGALAAFSGPHLTNLAYAAAITPHRPPLLMTAITGRLASGIVHTLLPHTLSRVAWSYARLQLQNVTLLTALADRVVSVLARTPTSLRPVQLATLVWAFASLRSRHQRFLDSIAARLAQPSVAEGLSDDSLVQCIWAFAELKFYQHQVMEALAVQVQLRLPHLAPNSLVVIVGAFASLHVQHLPLFTAVVRQLLGGDLASLSFRQLAKLAWACARVGFMNTLLMQAIAGRLQQAEISIKDPRAVEGGTARLNCNDLAQLAWAFAELRHQDAEPWQRFERLVLEPGLLQQCTANVLPTLMWSFARANVHHPGLYSAIRKRILDDGLLLELNGLSLTTLVWAYAELSKKDEELLAAAARRLVTPSVLRLLSAFEITLVAKSFAMLGVVDEPLMSHLARQLLYLDARKRLGPDLAGDLAQAFAKLSLHNEELVMVLATRCLDSPSPAPPWKATKALWALGTLRVAAPLLMEQWANHHTQPNEIAKFTIPQLTNVVWAYAKLRVRHPALMAAVAAHIAQKSTPLGGDWNCAVTIAWSYARLGMRSSTLMARLTSPLMEASSCPLSPQNAFLLSWAMARLQVCNPAVLKAIGDHIVTCNLVDQMEVDTLATLSQSFRSCAMQHPSLSVAIARRVRASDLLATLPARVKQKLLYGLFGMSSFRSHLQDGSTTDDGFTGIA